MIRSMRNIKGKRVKLGGALLLFLTILALWFFYLYVLRISGRSSVSTLSYDLYKPASVEQYFVENMVNLGYDVTETNPMTCNVWTDPLATSDDVHKKLIAYSHDLELYTKAVQNFKSVPDLLQGLKGNNDICRSLVLHPDGIQGLFPSNQLSYSTSGYIEPLLPPMRHHKMCLSQVNDIMSLDYLVHDFEAMCRKLKPTSRRILIDMGASLDFHGNDQPIVTLLNLYAKFGFNFDHIYAFEKTPMDPEELYTNRLPEKFLHRIIGSISVSMIRRDTN